MNEDQTILIASFSLYWLMLALLFWRSGSKSILLFNVGFHLSYSAYFLYGLEYKSEGGNSLAWWFYLVLIPWTHTVIHLAQLIYHIIKARKQQ